MNEIEIVPLGGEYGNGWDAPLGAWTFEYEPAHKIVLDHLQGRVLNACAGRTQLRYDGEIVRNDINTEREADTHYDVCEIDQHFEEQSFDTVVFDPPFDQKQSEEKYDGMHASDIHKALKAIAKLVKPNGVVITFGWNSWGMSTHSEFEREKTYMLQCGPVRQDVIVSVDRRTISSLNDWNGDDE